MSLNHTIISAKWLLVCVKYLCRSCASYEPITPALSRLKQKDPKSQAQFMLWDPSSKLNQNEII